MSQSYSYTPNPVVYGSSFNLSFTDNTGTIDGNNTYNLTDANSNVLTSFNNTNQVFGSGFSTPAGLAFDSNGYLYVGDQDYNTVFKVSPDGSTTTTFASGFNTPQCLTFDSNGNLYVGNYGNKTISKVNTNGSVSLFVTLPTQYRPTGLVCDNNGYLYVSCQNTNGTSTGGAIIKILLNNGSTVSTFTNSVSRVVRQPLSLAIDSNNYLYSCNTRASPTYTVITILDTNGNQIGLLNVSTGNTNILGIGINSYNNLYCTFFNTPSAVYLYEYKNSIGNPIMFADLSQLTVGYGMAFDSNNNVYFSDGTNIQRYATTQLPFTNATSNTLTNNSINNLSIKYGSSTLNTSNISVNVGTVPCFLKGTNILTDKGYIPIENLKKGDLIQTFKNGFVPIFLIGIFLIGNKEINNNDTVESPLYRLYKYTNELYPELFDDLIVTGGHSILVDEFTSEKQQIDNDNLFSCTTPLVDGKHRLLSCNNEKAVLYEKEGIFTVYHLALENESEFGEYGIFANGLLTESCSINFLKKCMNFS